MLPYFGPQTNSSRITVTKDPVNFSLPKRYNHVILRPQDIMNSTRTNLLTGVIADGLKQISKHTGSTILAMDRSLSE